MHNYKTTRDLMNYEGMAFAAAFPIDSDEANGTEKARRRMRYDRRKRRAGR